MKLIKKTIALLLALALCLSLLPASVLAASTVIAKGTCGDNLTWSLDSDNVLTVSGSGAMYDYSYPVDGYNGGGGPWRGSNSKIKTVKVGSGVTHIGRYAFAKLTKVTSVELPETLTSGGYCAFSGCTALTSVEIPSSLTGIGQNMFYGCSSLKEVTIHEGVQRIGISAFSYCTSLTSIDFPESITEIGLWAFSHCDGLETVYIPASVQTVGSTAFALDPCLTSITVDPDSPYFYSDHGVLLTKDGKTLISYPAANTGTSYTVPEGVDTIEKYAFYRAELLQTVNLPSSLRRIYDLGFYGCKSLTSIDLPKGMTMVHNEVFEGCESLVSVKLPSTMKTIGWRAFKGCTALTDLSLPAKVSTINHYAFQNCESLKSIAIPEGVTELHINTFSGCKSLESVSLPSTLKRINGGVFYGCASLKRISIPDSVTYVGTYCFSGCSALEEVKLSSNQNSISTGMFQKCTALTGITIPESVRYLCPKAFEDCTALDNVVVPPKVKIVQKNAFHRCKALTNVTLPYEIKIEEAGFRGCDNLAQVNYPGSRAAWKAISIGKYNLYLTKAKVNSYYKYLNYSTATTKYASYSYQGNPVQPVVTVRTPSGTKLLKDTNYTVEYLNNTWFGVGTIKITGIGKYFGELTLSFNIKPGKVGNLIEDSCTDTSSEIHWTASPGATKYEVRLGSRLLGYTESTSYTVTGLEDGRTRKVWVYPIGYGADPVTGEVVEYRGFGAYTMVNAGN